MYSNLQRKSDPDVRELRLAGGLWLKGLREKAGLTQEDLARRIEVSYYTFISQVENGRGRIPPDRYEAWAAALDVEPRAFVREIMRYYDPVTHDILFGERRADRTIRAATAS